MQKILLAALLLCSVTLSAQQRKWDRPMQLKRCFIDIKADPFTATTFIEMEFYNPNDQEIEGLYSFNLQPGQAITGFQLDLNGQYRDGSIEEKWKATNAYNTIVGKRIDPALLTMDGANHYNLRIYPVPARGSRRISMTIQQLLKAGKQTMDYLLPMNVRDTVGRVDLNIAVSNSPDKAFTGDGFLKGAQFWGNSPSWVFNTSYSHVILNKPLEFHIPMGRQPVVCTKESESNTYFALSYKPALPLKYTIAPKKLTVYWDISTSAIKRDIEKEISFLKQYVSYHNIEQLTVITFNFKVRDTAVFYTEQQFNSRYDQYLRNIRYDGATQLGTLDFSKVTDDVIFLFTDGINSYGTDLPKPGRAYLYCIASSRYEQVQLARIIGASGGEIIDLGKTRISEAIESVNQAENILMDIRSASGKSIIDKEQLIRESGRMLISGTLHGRYDTILFYYGNTQRMASVEKVVVDGRTSCKHSAIDRSAALQEFDRMINTTEWDKTLAFGKKERIVTPNTAYLVLERIEDYVKFNIEPPKDIEEECIRQGYVKRDIVPQVKKITEQELVQQSVNYYRNRINAQDKANMAPVTNGNTLVHSQADISSIQVPVQDVLKGEPAVQSMDEVVVIGYGNARRKSMTGASATIRSDELSQGFANVEQALQGRVAGVQVNTNNGFANQELSSIRIRGVSSFLGDQQPLFVIDGIPVAGNINDMVAVSDIDNISVLKDAAATAIYGSRGSNGVILINLKKGIRYGYSYFNDRRYKLKNRPDVEYLQEFKSTPNEFKMEQYRKLQEVHGDAPGFYFDIAQHLFEIGKRSEAVTALSNAAEVSHGSIPVLKGMAFILQSWKEYAQAVYLFEIIKENTRDIHDYRNLAMAYELAGEYQKAANTLYEAISRDWENFEGQYKAVKDVMMYDLNNIISRHGKNMDVSAIRLAVVQPLPVDLRIVIDGNINLGQTACISGGGFDVCSNTYERKQAYFTTGLYQIAEYQLKEAKEGKYKIRTTYHDGHRNFRTAPAMVRITVYKNFGRKDQTVEVQNVILDNQSGSIEIAEIKW
jgi:TonB-dependent SusC/RagA subfamily outer membrane receptor